MILPILWFPFWIVWCLLVQRKPRFDFLQLFKDEQNQNVRLLWKAKQFIDVPEKPKIALLSRLHHSFLYFTWGCSIKCDKSVHLYRQEEQKDKKLIDYHFMEPVKLLLRAKKNVPHQSSLIFLSFKKKQDGINTIDSFRH